MAFFRNCAWSQVSTYVWSRVLDESLSFVSFFSSYHRIDTLHLVRLWTGYVSVIPSVSSAFLQSTITAMKSICRCRYLHTASAFFSSQPTAVHARRVSCRQGGKTAPSSFWTCSTNATKSRPSMLRFGALMVPTQKLSRRSLSTNPPWVRWLWERTGAAATPTTAFLRRPH